MTKTQKDPTCAIFLKSRECKDIKYDIQKSKVKSNIARIANAVHCHSLLSGNKNCHEFRVSIVRIVISVSNVTSLQDCLGPQVCAPIDAYNSQCRGRQVFLGQVMSSHYSDPMSQRSQVSRIAPLGCSLMEVHMQVGRQVGRGRQGKQVFLGQVMSSDHPDQMSQRSQLSRVTLQCRGGSDCQWCRTKGQTDRQTCSPIELSLDS